MGDSSKFPDIASLMVSDLVLCTNQKYEILQWFSLIADRIQPHLSLNGSNFNTWSCNMIDIGKLVLLKIPGISTLKRSTLTISTILSPFCSSQTALSVHFKKSLSKASWSSIVNHSNINFHTPAQTSNLIEHVIDLGEAIEAIEIQLGPINSNNIITLLFFFSIPHLHIQFTTSLDTGLAANPSPNINSNDILDIVQQINGKSVPTPPKDSIKISQIDTLEMGNKLQAERYPGVGTPPYSGFPAPQATSPIANCYNGWKWKWLIPQNSCFYCGEEGHWAPDCPANIRASSSKKKEIVSSIGAEPILENKKHYWTLVPLIW
ncbi:hypothetical protein O181_085969 [Austropuccinia psidii MF-1]|uniref:CCHC-type domain-containing protein n=1 Tax=Austropuccinia psidii MF-1 TaxID=1389203 RepID=A0A9Q3FW37_9BASI|nr:hypothetical protein [Austropuccinia psidii MF-1]